MTTNRQTHGPRGRPPHRDVLTPAEWKVAEMVRHGLTNPAIAERIGVSLDAVKFHVGNALSKLALANRSELRLWGGVAAGTALHDMRSSAVNAHPQTDEYMMLGQVARTCGNVEEARVWYRETLGLPELYAFPGLAFFDLGGVRLMLTQEDAGSRASQSILYLRVPDIHHAKDRMEACGVAFTHAPHRIHRHEDGTEEWMAFFQDNEGRPLALMTQVRTQVR
jgi:DNA-binding CsgD family transcriptional regulator/catechol 2,3-dioxygenase-like lactoylglutathione lyase family enzyme